MAALRYVAISSVALDAGFGGSQSLRACVWGARVRTQGAGEKCCDVGGDPGQPGLNPGLTHPMAGGGGGSAVLVEVGDKPCPVLGRHFRNSHLFQEAKTLRLSRGRASFFFSKQRAGCGGQGRAAVFGAEVGDSRV